MRKNVEKYLKNNEYRELRNYVVENSENATLIYLANILYAVFNGACYLKDGEGNSVAECIIKNDFEGLKKYTTELPKMLIDPIIYYNNININYNIQGSYVDKFYGVLDLIDEGFATNIKGTRRLINMYLKSIGRSSYIKVANSLYDFCLLENDSSYLKIMLSDFLNPTYTPNEYECKKIVFGLINDEHFDACECYLKVVNELGFETDYLEYRLRMEKNNLVPETEDDIRIENTCDEIAEYCKKNIDMYLLKLSSNEDIKKVLWRLKSKCWFAAEKIKLEGKYEIIIFPKSKTREKVNYSFLNEYIPKQVKKCNYQLALDALNHSIFISDFFNIELVRQLMNIYKLMDNKKMYEKYKQAVSDYYECYGENSGLFLNEEECSIEDLASSFIDGNIDVQEYLNNNNISIESKNLLYIYLAKYSYEKGNIKNGDNYLKNVIHNKEKSTKVKKLIRDLQSRKRFIQYK